MNMGLIHKEQNRLSDSVASYQQATYHKLKNFRPEYVEKKTLG